jgi:hypothetical protein
MRISIQNPEFTDFFKRNPKGSTMLGYLRGSIVFHCESGGTCTMGLPGGLRVKLNQQGKLSLGAPSKEWEGKGGTPSEGRSGHTAAYRFDDDTYAALLQVVGAIPQVDAAVKRARTQTGHLDASAPSLAGLVSNPQQVAALIAALTAIQGASETPSAETPSESGTVSIG